MAKKAAERIDIPRVQLYTKFMRGSSFFSPREIKGKTIVKIAKDTLGTRLSLECDQFGCLSYIPIDRKPDKCARQLRKRISTFPSRLGLSHSQISVASLALHFSSSPIFIRRCTKCDFPTRNEPEIVSLLPFVI